MLYTTAVGNKNAYNNNAILISFFFIFSFKAIFLKTIADKNQKKHERNEEKGRHDEKTGPA